MKVVSHLVANKVLRYLSSNKGFIHKNKSLVHMEPKKKKDNQREFYCELQASNSVHDFIHSQQVIS